MFEGKSIILCVHEYAGFSATIKTALEDLGFNVFEMDTSHPKFKYSTFKQRAYNFIRKLFLGDKTYKNTLKQQAIENKLLQQLSLFEKADYALIIRADILPRSVIDSIKLKADVISAYQWDGLNRFKSIYEYIPLFDRFFVFDNQDLEIANTLPITNFYFDHIKLLNTNIKNKVTFIGSYFENRNKNLFEITKVLTAKNIEVDINIFTVNEAEIFEVKKLKFNHLENVISYEENLNNISTSSILLDVHINEHNGLSFRIFEGIGYDKKVITTNVDVVKYDFYDKNNIFIWNIDNEENLIDFLNTPYKPISPILKEKYAFSNWIRYAIDQKEYNAITLPK